MTNLAVRHRPRTFKDISGQRLVCEVLRNMLKRSDVPRQLLLAGPSGVGKTTTARVLVAALFCAEPPASGLPDACGVCESCVLVTGSAGGHPDVTEMDAASNGGIDSVRALSAAMSTAPLLAPKKVFIIDEAHGLTGAGSDAFLKLLEEAPEHCMFILATTEPAKLSAPLRGRCLQLYVALPSRHEIEENLRRVAAAEHLAISDSTCSALLDASDPALGVRGTMALLELVAPALRDNDDSFAHALLGGALITAARSTWTAVQQGDAASALAQVEQALQCGSEMELLRLLASHAHQALRDSPAHAPGGIESAVWALEQFVRVEQIPVQVRVARAATGPGRRQAEEDELPSPGRQETPPTLTLQDDSPAPAPATTNAPETSEASTSQASPDEFLKAVRSSLPPRTALALARSKVTVENNRFSVSWDTDQAEADHSQTLAAAAAACGYSPMRS